MIPTLFSAYFYGKRHATMTALASICLVTLTTYFNPTLFNVSSGNTLADSRWFDIVMWGGTLIVIAYTMGSLYDRKEAHLHELRETYNGVLIILRQFISKDKYTQNHSYRVALYAAKIAFALKLDSERIEDVRAAALLHDIGKLDISRELLYKAASLTRDEMNAVQEHVSFGTDVAAGSADRSSASFLSSSRITTSLTVPATIPRAATRFPSRLASSAWPTSMTR